MLESTDAEIILSGFEFKLYNLLCDLKWKWKLLSCVWLFVTPWTIRPWNSLGQNTGVGSLSILQGVFPIQESKRGLLHCGWILDQLSYQGNPHVNPFSRGSFQPRDWTQVSHIISRFFTSWASREAHVILTQPFNLNESLNFFVSMELMIVPTPSPWKRNAKKKNGCLRRPYK